MRDAIDEWLLRLADDERLARPALLLALWLDHKLPDCLYLALAGRAGAELVTADHRLARLAEGEGVPLCIQRVAKILVPAYRFAS